MPRLRQLGPHLFAGLLAVGAGLLPDVATAEPYQVEVLVFARPGAPAALAETNEHWPGCLARAQYPSALPGASGGITAVGTDGFQLADEAQALQRAGSELQVLAHTAWQQDISAATSGPWVRIGHRSDRTLRGCLRARLTPVPEIEIDLLYEAPTGERHSLFGTARIRPGDVHYFDHPALGTLVRLDSLADGVPAGAVAGAAAPSIPSAPTGVVTPAAAPPAPAAAATTPQPPPPPPKKPFRW